MKPWMHAVVYQTTWFITVLLGNVWSLLWALPLGWSIIRRQSLEALMFILVVTLLGYGMDLVLQALGLVTFAGNTVIGPLWLLVLWFSFANVIWHLLHRIPHIAFQSALGAAAGPLSYYGGALLGAAAPLEPAGLAAFAIWWAVAFPAAIALRHHWSTLFRNRIGGDFKP